MTEPELISMIIAGFAVLVSIAFAITGSIQNYKSLNISKESKDISQKALKEATLQFTSLNKPLLTTNPLIFSDRDSFFRLIDVEEKRMVIQIQFKIKNIGKLTAKDTFFKDVICEAYLRDKPFGGSNIFSDNTPGEDISWIDIPPGDDVIRLIKIDLQTNPITNIREFTEKFNKNGKIALKFSLQFKSPYSDDKKFSHIKLEMTKYFYSILMMKFS